MNNLFNSRSIVEIVELKKSISQNLDSRYLNLKETLI